VKSVKNAQKCRRPPRKGVFPLCICEQNVNIMGKRVFISQKMHKKSAFCKKVVDKKMKVYYNRITKIKKGRC
jgi:hypothetical protein